MSTEMEEMEIGHISIVSQPFLNQGERMQSDLITEMSQADEANPWKSLVEDIVGGPNSAAHLNYNYRASIEHFTRFFSPSSVKNTRNLLQKLIRYSNHVDDRNSKIFSKKLSKQKSMLCYE